MSTTTQTEQPQHITAMARANKVRFARADLKREVNRGDVGVPALLRGRLPANTASIPVAELLGSQRRWGATRTRKLLASLVISELRPVADLTARQRHMLAQALEEGEVRDQRLLAA